MCKDRSDVVAADVNGEDLRVCDLVTFRTYDGRMITGRIIKMGGAVFVKSDFFACPISSFEVRKVHFSDGGKNE